MKELGLSVGGSSTSVIYAQEHRLLSPGRWGQDFQTRTRDNIEPLIKKEGSTREEGREREEKTTGRWNEGGETRKTDRYTHGKMGEEERKKGRGRDGEEKESQEGSLG